VKLRLARPYWNKPVFSRPIRCSSRIHIHKARLACDFGNPVHFNQLVCTAVVVCAIWTVTRIAFIVGIPCIGFGLLVISFMLLLTAHGMLILFVATIGLVIRCSVALDIVAIGAVDSVLGHICHTFAILS
jgi:hypothetical protein